MGEWVQNAVERGVIEIGVYRKTEGIIEIDGGSIEGIGIRGRGIIGRGKE